MAWDEARCAPSWRLCADWIPAYAGMTWSLWIKGTVRFAPLWIPAYAGMTIGYAKVSSGRGAGRAPATPIPYNHAQASRPNGAPR